MNFNWNNSAQPSKRKGFTLAEVLLTLTIIGTVAALTIPTLIQSTTNNSLATQWRKEYSTISEAIQIITNNPNNNGVYPTYANATAIRDGFAGALNAVRTCAINTAGCWATTWYQYNGATANAIPAAATSAGMVLADGAYVQFGSAGTNFFVDVNGSATPNAWGRDIYGGNIVNNSGNARAVAFNETTGATGAADSCATAGIGYACSTSVLANQP